MIFLFVFGVESESGKNFTKRYDASMDTWIDMTPIQRPPAHSVAAIHCQKDIFLIGGSIFDAGQNFDDIDHRGDLVDDVYKYSILNDNWVKCDNLPEKCGEAAAALIDGLIYCSGGTLQGGAFSSKFYAYDTETNKWEIKKSMNIERSGHILEVVGDKLYAMGGISLGFEQSVETFDTQTHDWTIIPCHFKTVRWDDKFAVRCQTWTSFTIGQKIYLFPGERGGGILEYDTDQKTLVKMRHNAPDTNCRMVSAFMTLSKLVQATYYIDIFD